MSSTEYAFVEESMIQIRPMDENQVHIPCLHEGPIDLSALAPSHDTGYGYLPPHPWSDETIVELAMRCPGISHGDSDFEESREFLREMILRYGACALLAWDGRLVVGQIRFYPMAIARLIAESQTDPSPLLDCTAACEPGDDEDTLWVQCVMTSAPYINARDAKKVGARKGIGSALAQALISWAGDHGWRRIIKVAHCDLDWFYGIQGGGGRAFWEKAGFKEIGSFFRRAWDFAPDAWSTVKDQMNEKGMSERDIWTWYRMAYDL